MNSRPLRVGIVGGNADRGWSRDAHVPALATLPQFIIAAVSARTQALADQAAAAFKAPRAFGDSLALVRDPGIDVVAVTVKVPEHRAIVLAALEAGKHVYCEWPLGRDVAEAQEMADAAARAKSSHVMIGLQALSSPAVRHAQKLVDSGALGELRMLRVLSPTAGWGKKAPLHYAYLQDKRNGATMMTITAGHTIAAMEAIARRFVEVDARCTILQKNIRLAGSEDTIERTCADHALIVGRHASGCVSSLEVIGGQPSMAFRLELLGTAGSLTITDRRTAPGDYQVNKLDFKSTVSGESAPEGVSASLEGPPANLAEAYARLEADIRASTRTVPDFQVALRLAKLLDSIDVASEQGRRQHIAS